MLNGGRGNDEAHELLMAVALHVAATVPASARRRSSTCRSGALISLVPTPSALERMIAARQACFCEVLRSLVIASSRPRTDRVIVMEIPVRMRQTRTATETGESQSELSCQAKTTSRTE